MNAATVLQILIALPSLITAIETLYPASGSGAQKAEAVQAAVTQMIDQADLPEFMKSTWPKISAYISALVALYNAASFFKRLASK